MTDTEINQLMFSRYHSVSNLLSSVNLEVKRALKDRRSDEEIAFFLGRENKGLLGEELVLCSELIGLEPFPGVGIMDVTLKDLSNDEKARRWFERFVNALRAGHDLDITFDEYKKNKKAKLTLWPW